MKMATAPEKPRDTTVRIAEPERESRPRPPPLEMSSAGPSMDIPKTPTRREKEKKLGHRRVDDTGQVTYKKKPTSELMAAMQLGIGQSITILTTKPKRDLLLQDFTIVETVFFPREGSNLTPAHHYSDFRFKTFAPIAFRYFRELFSIQPDDFLLSLCNEALNELSNPGASGSIFYITNDDEFIIKTVQHKEAEFLQKLLPGYYMNLNQNPRTLLPKFYGLYCYQCGGKNIRFVVMNNLLPSSVRMHEKYDLKGSTYKRKACKRERAKRSPTLKDLDFVDLHPEGLMLEADTYSALINTINRDCRVLQSFKIMDYSLLLGIHNLDQAARERHEAMQAEQQIPEPQYADGTDGRADVTHNASISRGKSIRRVAQYSTAMEAIQARAQPLELDNEDIPPGGIPARNSKGERLLLYIGLIDILQSYRLKKKMEHAFKAMVHDGDTISVHRPGFYSTRFQQFFANRVFKKIPSLDQPQVKGPHMRFKKLVQLALKHSPSKKRSGSQPGRQRSVTTSELEGRTSAYFDRSSTALEKHRTLSDAAEPAGAVGGRPDLLPENSTPPPTFAEAIGEDRRRQMLASKPEVITTSPSFHNDSVSGADSQPGQLSGSGGGVGVGSAGSGGIGLIHSPVHSISESTPTHTEYTEGTPSFTTSSPSCSSDMLDSLPSTTKSTRREFHNGAGGGICSTPPPPAPAPTTATSTTSSSHVEVSHEQIEFELPPDNPPASRVSSGRPLSLAEDGPPEPDEEDRPAQPALREDGEEPEEQDTYL